uniref:Protein kinase domain-containing protein n=1 Tax=Oryza brachyantha TaxID=4533 RepID=J3MD80_ORYBR
MDPPFFFLLLLLLLLLSSPSAALLSAKGVNTEVQALIVIKNLLRDPHGVLKSWDQNSVDPCSWAMITCSPESLVTGLEAPSQHLSGLLAPSIGNLTNLETVLLQNNNITGPIPAEIGRLASLKTLDLSSNQFYGEIPNSVGHLESLQYLRLNNNTLSGPFPSASANLSHLVFLDLSYNNLSGPIPGSLARTYNIVGNPLICDANREQDCYGTAPMPISYSLNGSQAGALPPARTKGRKFAVAFGSTAGVMGFLLLAAGFLFWWRHRRNRQILFDVDDQHLENVNLGNVKRFHFRELQAATDSFSSKNILGKGGFGNVYRGQLPDGTRVAVKRLKDGNAAGGEAQFQTEVEMISLALHRNLLRLYGFCMTATERLLVYPYMSNGSVASRLKGTKNSIFFFSLSCERKLQFIFHPSVQRRTRFRQRPHRDRLQWKSSIPQLESHHVTSHHSAQSSFLLAKSEWGRICSLLDFFFVHIIHQTQKERFRIKRRKLSGRLNCNWSMMIDRARNPVLSIVFHSLQKED